MRTGHDTANPLRVPPKCEATCFIHWNGASSAQAQPTLKWFSQRADPKSPMCSRSHSGSSGTPFWKDGALHAPWIVPSADAPLSPVTYSTSVFSPTPSWSTASSTRPTWASVWAINAAKTSMSRVATGLYLSG